MSKPATPDHSALFEALYASDLVYKPDCWKLCGDAHCCNFERFKPRFRLLARGRHELPLLPGEFEFLVSKGWDRQFQDYDRNVTDYDFGEGSVRLETVASLRHSCLCDHGTRTVICRFYPLLPVFDIDGKLTGTEVVGVYDELERLDALEPACRLGELPFEQLNLFLRMCGILASSPLFLFHLAAYRAAKRHVFSRLASAREATQKSAFTLFESAYLRRRLFDHDQLKAELAALKRAYDERYGAAFSQALAGRASAPAAPLTA